MSERRLTLEPDPWMRWIYHPQHPDYHSAQAQALRDARARALAKVPSWMKWSNQQ